jgi:UDP-N-acetylglucosamine--N-acetylmuramyl-(pentapeptide) pyrophosphoryl-undecaprenol N-acetylglucosamine transferase
MKVLLTGGGTGGHINPAIATAEALRSAAPEVLFVGTRGGLEARLVPAAGYPIRYLPSRPVGRKLSPGAVLSLAVTGAGVVAAFAILARERPDAVASTGGYAGAALGVASALRGVPLLLFEPNAVPGRTNLLLARWAKRVAVAYPGCVAHFGAAVRARVVVTGTPVRPDIGREDPAASRRAFGLHPEQFTLLVVGGSAGARTLNQAVTAAAPVLLDAGVQILHQTGSAHFEAVRAATSGLQGRGYLAVAYLENMGRAYAAAHVILCRAGASTLAEVTRCGLPALLVPYPFAVGDHQTHNARELERAGAGKVIPDRDLTPEALTEAVLFWRDHPEERARAAAASRSLACPDAAARVAALLEEIAGKRKP